MPSQTSRLSTGCGLVAIVLWSSTIAIARSLSEQLGPLTASASVYLVGGLFCLGKLGWTKTSLVHFRKLPAAYLLGCGFLFVFYTAALYLAVGLARDRDQALEVGLINYLWPAATLLFSLVLLDKRANWLLWPGTALALTGIFLVMTQGAHITWTAFWTHLRTNPAAFSLALAAAISWALYSNLTRRWAAPGHGGAVELFIPATGLLLWGLQLLANEPGRWSPRALWETLFLGAITALAYVFWDIAMRKGNLLLVAACSYFTPMLSTLVSCAYLNIMPGSRLWTGCALLVAGSLLSWRSLTGNSRERMPPV